MVEGTFQSVDPLAYYVNNVADFDRELVAAFKRNDNETLKKLVVRGTGEYDIFICVSKKWHGFVLCVPAGTDPQFEDMIKDVIKSPFDVDDRILCYVFELCFDDKHMRTYKIAKDFDLFAAIKRKIGSRSYFIGHYKDIGPSGFQLAAMRAAPHRYAVLLDDCVEFSKEFCVQALAYSSNWRDIEEQVHNNIKKASATGFSGEHLSRQFRPSGWLGNATLGGTDIGTMLSGRNPVMTWYCFIVFVLVYPVVVLVIGLKLAKYG